MKIDILNQKGEKIKDMQISSAFDTVVSKETLALYINYLRNALRGPVANTKDRGEVSGGGKKPFKQKGTGRARQGSSRSPLWVGGGVTFGPTSERNYQIKINKSQRKKVILGIFGEAFKENKAIIVENLALENPKTKDASLVLNNVKAEGKISVIINETDKNADMAFRNLSGVSLMAPRKLDVISLISSDKVVLSQESLKQLEELFSSK
jgi:large subunit ribosomal protein L4